MCRHMILGAFWWNHGSHGSLTRGEVMKALTMRQLLTAGVHFGHQTSFWNPEMKPFVFGKRGDKKPIHIINLEKTLPMLTEALEYLGHVIAHGGKAMFVGTKFAASDVIREEASRCGMPYVDYRWLGGMLTNYKTIRQSVKRFKDLDRILLDDNSLAMTKKEKLNLTRERDKLALSLSGVKDMGSLPDCLLVIDVGAESIAIKEANRLGIPVIGVVDTNNSPKGVDYVIPGNDDAIRAIRLYCKAFADLIIEIRGTPEEIEAQRKQKEEERQAKLASKVVHKKSTRSEKEPSAAQEASSEATSDDSGKAPAKTKRKTVTKKLVEKADATDAKKAPKKTAAKKTPAKKAAVKKTAVKEGAEKAKASTKAKSEKDSADA